MKLHSLLLSCFLLSSLAQAQPAPPREPLYIFISTSVGDHMNHGITEERLRRGIGVIEKYRASSPTLSFTVCFSGAMSDALATGNAQDHLLDEVRAAIAHGAVRPCYDGSDEPTYEQRPMLDFSQARNSEDRWMARTASAQKLLTEARDSQTGAPRTGVTGGLKRMQEVFGPATLIRGVVLQFSNLWGQVNEVGSDSEIVNAVRPLNHTALMIGLPETDLAHTSGSQFRSWANVFGKVISPDPDSSPELWWQEDVLRFSETSLMDARTFRAEEGVAKLKAVLSGMDRSRVRILHLEIAGQRIYVKPPVPPAGRMEMPLAWAYHHPEDPLFPARLRYSQAEVDARYGQEDEVIRYLTSEFLPANPGSRFVSAPDLKSMAKPGLDYDISIKDLRASVKNMVAAWGDKTTLPPFLKVGDRYLSLADLFVVLTDSLAQRSRTGKDPSSLRLTRVFGPVSTPPPGTPVEDEVTVQAVLRLCASLNQPLHDQTWRARPANTVPSPVTIEGVSITTAQFLRLMAEALLASAPETKLRIKPTDMYAGKVMTYFTRRLPADYGAPWTYKPAVIDASGYSR